MLGVVLHERLGSAVRCPSLSVGRVQLFHPRLTGGEEGEDAGVSHQPCAHVNVCALRWGGVRHYHDR
jgi:hypothetical protein